MDDVQKKRFQFLIFIIGVILLTFTAEKCRQMVGEEHSSQSGKFSFLNCLDGGTGSLACVVKEGVKLYSNNIRAAHVEKARHEAVEHALVDAISQGLSAKDSAKLANKQGAKAAKLAGRKANRIIGPVVSCGWDFFEAVYFGGSITEGLLRGTGTLFGTYAVGYLGEERFGRFGYLVGSHLGSWVGGRIGLMVYDVVNGVQFLLYFAQADDSDTKASSFASPNPYADSFISETPSYYSSDSDESTVNKPQVEESDSKAAAYENSEAYDNSYASESPTYATSEGSEEFNGYTPPSYEMSEEL